MRDILDFVSHASVARVVTEIEATVAGIKKYIDMQNSYKPFEKDKCFDLAIERKKDCKAIGLLSLIRRDYKQGQIGWALGIRYRNSGYATEAAKALVEYGFGTLGLHRIYADTTGENAASWRVMERIGMIREACLREAEFRNGRWLDKLTYAIIQPEWRNGRKS